MPWRKAIEFVGRTEVFERVRDDVQVSFDHW